MNTNADALLRNGIHTEKTNSFYTKFDNILGKINSNQITIMLAVLLNSNSQHLQEDQCLYDRRLRRAQIKE